ncbi:MAG: hypothetical protein M3N14_03505 [Bacteroidota bacterium]|nr:hypothetical protein [Bacteroidota bacterium]
MSKKSLQIKEQVNALYAEEAKLHPAFFLIGNWRFLFTERQVKVMIARALNWCVTTDKMEIAGYLITYKRLCLVLRHEKADAEKLTKLFPIVLTDSVTAWARDTKPLLDIKSPEKATADDADLFDPILTPYPAIDNYLVWLITGRTVDIPYYDPYLERLKIVTHAAEFCSAGDYLGAEGPVLVTLISSDQAIRVITDN